MRLSAEHTFSTVLLALVALVLSACGGGGGGGDDPDLLGLGGASGFLLIEWIGADDYTRSTVGTLAPDGAGGLSVDILRSVQAGLDETVALAPMTYIEDGPESAVITDGSGRRFHADIAADGSLIAATTRDMGTDPALLLILPRAEATSLAELAGDWMEMTWVRETDGSGAHDVIGDQALALEQSLDVGGELLIGGGHEIRFEEYSFLPAFATATTHVGVMPGGILTWRRHFDDALTHLGNLSADGNVMLLGGEYSSTLTGGTICVRRGLATRTADLTGTYRSCGLGSSAIGHHVRWGTVDLDGANAGSGTHTHNIEGLVLGPATEPLHYVVDLEGRLTVKWSEDRVPFYGIVGPDGAYAILAGGFRDGEPAEIHVLVR